MDIVLNKIKEISLKYNDINKIVLFGSRARGDNTPYSDYDIAIFMSYNNPDEQLLFIHDIEEIETLNKIDLVFIKKRHKDTDLLTNILREGIEIMNKFQIKFDNYSKALMRLHEAIDEASQSKSLTVRDGAIQRFEFTTELAWKTMREYLLMQEITDINSPKNVLMEAYKNKLITDDSGWLQILRDRNSTSHIYDEEDATEIYNRIATTHIELFDTLKEKLK